MAKRWRIVVAGMVGLAGLLVPSVSAWGQTGPKGDQAPAAETATPAATPGDGTGPPEIVGGTPAGTGEFPYQVALLRRSVADPFQAQFCGGALISAKRVLTAAHCLVGETEIDVDVLVGTNRLEAGSGRRMSVRAIHLHPRFNETTFANDLATLDLNGSATQTPVRVIPPDRDDLWVPGTTAQIVGWGALSEGGSFPVDLFKAEVPVQSDPTCQSALGADFQATTMFCAGPLAGGVDTCQGDSGGPISVGTGTERRQIGVVSWGVGCARPDLPGVYTRLDHYGTTVDDFVNAATIPGGGGTASTRTFLATKQPGEPNHTGERGGASVWFKWRAPATGRVTIGTGQSSFDTLLGVYRGSSVSSLTRVASNDDVNFNAGVLTSRVSFTAQRGVTYRIAVDGFFGDFGNVRLRVQRG